MKKTLTLTLILVVLLLIFTSCNVGNEGANEVNQENEVIKQGVTFNPDNGSDKFIVEAERGTGVLRPGDPEKEGYTFLGWYVGDEKWSFIKDTVSYNIELTAKWEPVIYKIEYEGCEGSLFTYTIEDEIELFGKSSDERFSFEGWYKDKEYKTEKITKIEKGTTGDLKLYGKVVEIAPKFTFVQEGSYGYTLIGCETTLEEITVPRTYLTQPVNKISSYAFYTCKNLKKINLPYGIKTIGEGAFAECKSLTEISLPSSVTEIGNYAFLGCNALERVYLSSETVSIGEGAFNSCLSLKEIIIPKSVEIIKDKAFSNTPKLTIYALASMRREGWAEAFSQSPVVYGYQGQKGITDSGIKWAMTLDGVVITGYEGESVSVVLPSLINIYSDSWLDDEYPFDRIEDQEGIEDVAYTTDYAVTGICEKAFMNEFTLESIIIPSSIIRIGEGAFSGCTRLKIFAEAESKPEGWALDGKTPVVYGYKDELGTTESGYTWAKTKDGTIIVGYNGEGIYLEIPTTINGQSVIAISNRAFYYNVRIESVIIHESIKTIGKEAFSNCSRLKKVEIKGATRIEEQAFNNCIALEKIELGNSLEYLGMATFEYCSALKEIKLPSGITKLEMRLFSDCKKLEVIEINGSLTEIGSSAMSGCTALKSFEIPSTVVAIGKDAFTGCESLLSIKFPKGITVIEKGTMQDCKALNKIELPTTLLEIQEGAFSGCISLEKIEIPTGVTTLYLFAFHGCNALKEIILPNTVTSVGYGAFGGCVALEKVQLSTSLESLNTDAFIGCEKLSQIYLPASITQMGRDVFKGCVSLTIYAEAESQPEGWDKSWNSSNCNVVWGYTEQ